MKKLIFILSALLVFSCKNKETQNAVNDQPAETAKTKHLFLDVHNLEPGKVTFDAVAGAHQKDLATQGKFGVSFLKYWVDEGAGKVYCLVESPDSASVYHSHKEAHGLVPDFVHQVSDGVQAAARNNENLYLDVHNLGAGKVTKEAVAEAHVKDLKVQDKYKVNLINYWVDEKMGVVMCLAEAPDSTSLIKTHKEAHGLIPDEVHKVQQGN